MEETVKALSEEDKKRVIEVVREAAKILRDNPHLKYEEAIEKAKELLK